MGIISYLAHSHEGKRNELYKALQSIEDCEVIPAENEDVIVVVTDTESKQEDDKVKEQIEAIESLKLLAMVSGFNTPKN
ncbi:MAG: chaperone NapD [Flavobacteriaceae bacterium]